LIIFLSLVLVVFFAGKIKEMPIDVFPEFAPPYVEIQTEGPGMSAREIESLVTVQLENTFANIPGVEDIRSKSVEGLSSVRLIFEMGTDPVSIRQLVQEKLVTITSNLPKPADGPRILQPLSSTSRVMKIGISSEKYSLMDLSMTSY
jgi:Cu/Ag efflux pump CusA